MMQDVIRQLVTGQFPPFSLLKLGVLVFLYFLPSVLAFHRGHRKFWFILPLNVFVFVIQAIGVYLLLPGMMTAPPQDPMAGLAVVALVFFGPIWLLLLAWSLRPVPDPDARLLAARQTKTYDALAGLPLILWFVYGVMQLRPTIARDAHQIASGQGGMFVWVQLLSLSMAVLFYLLLIWLLLVRDRPKAKSAGVLPRVFGFVGSFMGVSILSLPMAHLNMGWQIVALLLIGLGSLASALVLWRLGKSFSIMPEARTLVTSGPYVYARHPLYTVEMITIVGTALQFQAPWSWVLAVVVMALLCVRSHYEEQVLGQTFPEYAAYRARTKRFIPGII